MEAIALILEGVLQVAVTLGFELASGVELGRRQRRAHSRLGSHHPAPPASPAVQRAFGALVLGAVLGTVFSLLAPRGLHATLAITSVSLLVAPLLGYFMMRRLGAWYAARGQVPSFLASGPGGAAFAFGFALVRLVVLLASNVRAA